MAIKKIKDARGRFLRDHLGRYQYELRFRASGRQRMRRQWLVGDAEALAYIAREHGMAGDTPATWETALALYERVKGDSLSAHYLEGVRAAVARIVKAAGPAIADCSLAAFSTYLRERAEEVKPITANRDHQALLAVARHARSQGIIDAIPFDHARKLPQAPLERRPFPPEHLAAYLEAMDSHARPLFIMLALTGERVSAIAGLDWKDVEADRITVTIKGGSRRAILLTEEMRRALDLAAVAYTPKIGVAYTPKIGVAYIAEERTGSVFRNARGSRFTADWLDHYLKKLWAEKLKPQGIPYHTPHSLRHLLGNLAADANFSRDKIQAALGHLSSQTADHYIHQDEARALEVHRATHITLVSHLGKFLGMCGQTPAKEGNAYQCPRCGHIAHEIKEFTQKNETV